MMLKLAGDVETSVDPIAGGTLVHTDTQGLTTTIEVPPAAVSLCTDMVYTSLLTPTETLDPGDAFAQHAFFLHAYPCASRQRVYLPLVVRGMSSDALSTCLAPFHPNSACSHTPKSP